MRALAALLLAGLCGGCGLSLTLASLQPDPETTASLGRAGMPLDPALDEEDWRRAQAALSLAVDPQGSGLPVNWDNPGSGRRGSFAPAGNMVLADSTICRPFTAVLVHAGGREARHRGEACRTGPGEWALRSLEPAAQGASARVAPGAGAASAPLALAPTLPARAAPMLPAGTGLSASAQ